jgi:hypothetical protein
MRFEDIRVLHVQPLSGYRLLLRYPDGYRLIDLSVDVHAGGLLGRLKPMEVFAKVGSDEYGVVTWPCNIEIGPDTLYEESTSVSDEWAERLLGKPLEASATGMQTNVRIVISQAVGLRKRQSVQPGSTEAGWTPDFLMEASPFLESRNREFVLK